MGATGRLRREWRYLSGLVRTLLRVRSIAPDSPNLVCDDLEAAMARWPDRVAFRFQGHCVAQVQLSKNLATLPLTRSYMMEQEKLPLLRRQAE